MMSASKSWTAALMLAGLLQVGIAAVHFRLLAWVGADRASLPPQLGWGLFTLNFSWSLLVMLIGIRTLYATKVNANERFVRVVVAAAALFWAVHGLYVALTPMAVPPRLAWIQAPIVAFPFSVAALLLIALVGSRSRMSSS